METLLKQKFNEGNFQECATLFMQENGNVLMGFIASRVDNYADASEIFSLFAEDFWRGLPGFQWKCSLRSWSYVLARHAVQRFQVRGQKQRAGIVPISECEKYLGVVSKVRTETREHLKTEVKSKMRELIKLLPEAEQVLLSLRLDKQLTWKELAFVFSGGDQNLSTTDIERLSARMRQQFQAIKRKLRTMAENEGII